MAAPGQAPWIQSRRRSRPEGFPFAGCRCSPGSPTFSPWTGPEGHMSSRGPIRFKIEAASEKPAELLVLLCSKCFWQQTGCHWLPASPPSPAGPSCSGPQEVPRWLFWDGPCLRLVSLCRLSDPPCQLGDSMSQLRDTASDFTTDMSSIH